MRHDRTVTTKEKREHYPRRGILVAVIVAVAIVDQITKAIALMRLEGRDAVSVIGDFFQLRLVFNPGAAFSFGTEFTWVFTTLQLLYIVAVLYFSHWLRSPISAIAAGLVAGGALGNLIDRLTREPGFYVGHVVDFFSLRGFAVFNVADCAITIGIIILMSWLLFSREPDLFAAQLAAEKQGEAAADSAFGATEDTTEDATGKGTQE